MSAEPYDAEPKPAATTPRHRGLRGTVAIALVVIAGLLFPAALVGFWAQRAVLDPVRYNAAVAPLAADPQVQAAVAGAISERLHKIDIVGLVEPALPDALKGLGDSLRGLITQLVDNGVTTFVESDAFAKAWAQANAGAQDSLVRSLQGDNSGAVTAQGTQIVLDTGVLIQQLRDQLATGQLSALASIPLPPSLSQDIVLVDTPQLSHLVSAYRIVNPAAGWLIFAVLAMFVVAVIIAVRRWLVIALVGIALLLGTGALWLAESQARSGLQDNLNASALGGLAEPYWSAISEGLIAATKVAAIAGAVLAIAGITAVIISSVRRPASRGSAGGPPGA